MSDGITGKILWVDLSNGEIATRRGHEEDARKYIGGAGLAAKIIWDNTSAATEPFSADNLLVFMTGPITGTRVPTSGRYVAAALSPLTNIWGQAHAGGTWGHGLKLAGWDGIVVKGAAKNPVYLFIDDDKVEIRDAANLWGKDTWTVDEILKIELGQQVSIAAIGQAGERLVRFSGIMTDGKLGRAIARCGLGAVMGSKKLKAIAVKGHQRPQVFDEAGLKNSVAEKYVRKHLDWAQLEPRWRVAITKMWTEGKVGIKNFQSGRFDGFEHIFVEDVVNGEKLYCNGCSAGCIESKRVGDKRQMVGEHLACIGARCLIDDVEALAEAYDLCNKYGIDSMSLGGVIAFAMELYEKGIITRKDTGGIDLKWGNAEAMLTLVEQIGKREGFGTLLGEGVKRVAEKIGGLAPEYAIHVKGHEPALYDVRAFNAGAVENATASSGAHHMEGCTMSLSLTSFLGDDDVAQNRFAVQGIGRLTAKAQDYGNLIDSLVVCKFLIGWTQTGQITQPEHLLEWLNLVTGWNMSREEFFEAGERIFNLKRMINVRRGISRKDDTLPPRLLTHKRGGGEGGAADNLPPLGIMLNEYYAHRGWSEEGIPTRAKLSKLGLTELIEYGG